MAINYKESVDLHGSAKTMLRGTGVDIIPTGFIKTCSLAEAVRTVIVEWKGDAVRQEAASIITDGETIYQGYDEIAAIWDRPDFPRRAP